MPALLAAVIAVGGVSAECAAPPARFSATVHPVSAEELGPSWHPGCPVPPEQLRRVHLSHVDFDGGTRNGDLVVNQDRVPQVIEVFQQLYDLKFPIEKMHPPSGYPGARDELSMRDNNTSAFSCRDIPDSGAWSQHAHGRAIDVNPKLNPYVERDGFEPGNAAAYLDRARRDPGLLHDGDPAVRVFTDRGWTWGGHWQDPIDYQHFELP
ncbi:M15 family metallopeptidase [Saccharopolyspora taberi]|uniref:M15 family metallopeptidase n=1 Tax=Saccharopolyspora taberi TaxID=60895 RepID=A0ABN3VHE5_9PSEU